PMPRTGSRLSRLVAIRPVTVKGEPGRLRQVLSNLLDNALKFTPAGGSVECSLSVDDPAYPGWATLEVADSGPGVPEESLERVFDRFNRTDPAHQPMRPKGGSGLGLSICRAIIRAVGGSIRMENRPTGGARLVVKLPCA
ncbi:MAG: sensor histidine kinase, partial [Gemmataceae bacterium]